MSRYPYKAAVVAAALAAVLCTGSLARAERGNDALPVLQARISLSEAVAAAERQANGRASRAEYEHTRTGWAYDVEVVSGSTVYDVKVDADKGTVLSSVPDKADRDDGRDHDD